MRKIYMALLFLLTGFLANSQTNIANYTLNKSVGTYTPITGGTVFIAANAIYDENISGAITIPSFMYGGVAQTSLYISANGFITFGSAPSSTNYTPLSSGTLNGAISAFGRDLGISAVSTATVGATSEIRYEQVGSEFVVQYQDVKRFDVTNERLTAQIRINSSNGEIKIVYGPNAVAGSNTTYPQVGIRGASTNWASNVNNLRIANVPAATTCSWADAVTGESNTSTMYYNSSNIATSPTNGLTLTWAPPAVSVLPVRTFASVTGITTTGATLPWTVVASATGGYNVQYRVVGTCSWTNWSGNPVATNTVSLTGLASNTTYQVRVQSTNGTINSIWSHMPSATAGDGYVAAGTFTTLSLPPANDDCAAAVNLTVNADLACGVKTSGTTFGATASTGETAPSCFATSFDDDVWFKFTATATSHSIVLSNIVGVSNDLITQVYSGACGSLSLVSCNDPESFTASGLTIGAEYYVRVSVYQTTNRATFDICVGTTPAAPSCTSIIAPADGANGVAKPVALSWNAAPAATSYDVYLGTVNPPTNTIATNVTGTSYNYTAAAYGTLYYWYVVPKNIGGSATGCDATVYSFTTEAAPPPPANDDCAGAVDISNGATYNGNSTTGSASSPTIPGGCSTGNADDDVWYKFTPVANGGITITVVGMATQDPVVQLLQGSCGSFTQVGTCVDNTNAGGTENLTATGLIAGQTYYVRIWDYQAGAGDAFSITAIGSSLPVNLITFTGSRVNNINKLTWSTATEVNNAGFELQRSADGINYTKLSYVASKAINGNSNSVNIYSSDDIKPYVGNAYYRLKQIDKDGKSTLSNVVMIKGQKVNAVTLSSVYPNPVKHDVNVIISAPAVEKLTVFVTDLSGKVIKQQITNAIAGDNKVSLNVSNLANGTYIVKVQCANGCEAALQKFVKN